MSDIIVFKLVTGEEIIGEVVNSDSAGTYYLQNVLGLVMSQGPDGKIGVSAFPWGTHVEGEIPIQDEHIIYSGAPVADLVGLYNKAFSRIATPPQGLVLPS
jgi:hypothetical protein